MWSSLIFGIVVAVGALVAWKCYKRKCRWDDTDEHEANAITPAPRVPRTHAYGTPYRRQVQTTTTATATAAPDTSSVSNDDFMAAVLLYEMTQRETETKPTFEGAGGSFGGGGASDSWDSSSSDSGSSSSDSGSSSNDY